MFPTAMHSLCEAARRLLGNAHVGLKRLAQMVIRLRKDAAGRGPLPTLVVCSCVASFSKVWAAESPFLTVNQHFPPNADALMKPPPRSQRKQIAAHPHEKPWSNPQHDKFTLTTG
jgi:hypothetical protein